QAHEREERVARELARTKCAVEFEGGECLGRGRQAEARVVAVDPDPDEGIHERKGAGDVPPRVQRLDEPDLGERCLQLRRAGLPIDEAFYNRVAGHRSGVTYTRMRLRWARAP